MPAPVFLLGAREDLHVAAVAERLGERALVLDTLAFPATATLSATNARDAAVRLDGRELPRPAAVYVRSLCAHPHQLDVDLDDAMKEDWSRTLAALGEKGTLLGALVARWESAGVPVYNPPSSGWRLAKPTQLALFEAAGLPVPDTLWTNDPEAARAFARGRRVIYKPVAGGALTRELTEDDLTDARMETLASAPVTFQELLPGEDIRVYVLNDRVVASLRVYTSSIDFRGSEESIEPIELPAEVADQCRTAARVLGLRWTGIDLKRDTGGTLRLLEANSSPMFLGFDHLAGTDVLGHLAEALAAHATTA